MHTRAISGANFRYQSPNSAPPANGPSNQPTAPHPTLLSPIAMIGSIPNRIPPNFSRSCPERIWMPATVVTMDVEMDATRLKRRRTARSARKRFQVRAVAVVGGEEGVLDVEAGVTMVEGGVREEVVSAFMEVGLLAATLDSAHRCGTAKIVGAWGRARKVRKASIGEDLLAGVVIEDT